MHRQGDVKSSFDSFVDGLIEDEHRFPILQIQLREEFRLACQISKFKQEYFNKNANIENVNFIQKIHR
jgi:hypothetical protein